MATWTNICQLVKYADKSSERTYQKSIKEMVLEIGLGWSKSQITEQLYMPIGSREKIISDIVVSKDKTNRFVVEMKKHDNTKNQKNISQLVSYMKQLETPVGIYFGEEIDVYYKTIGDGSSPVCLMSLTFKPENVLGKKFIELFSAENFSIDKLKDFYESEQKRILFEEHVNQVTSNLLSYDFKATLSNVIQDYYKNLGEDVEVSKKALDRVNILISKKETERENTERSEKNISKSSIAPRIIKNIYGRKNNGYVQRYAYGIVKEIIDRNPRKLYRQLLDIFGNTVTIRELNEISDEGRWFMDEDDIITLYDGTKIAVSNQWGLNGTSKPKMDGLRALAQSYGIDTTLPQR